MSSTSNPFIIYGSTKAPNTLELFVDFVCPVSYETWANSIVHPKGDSVGALNKLVGPNKVGQRVSTGNSGKYADFVKVVVRPHIQVIHTGSILTNQVALAFLGVVPEYYWDYLHALYKAQNSDKHYFDKRVDGMSPNDIRKELFDTVARNTLTQAGASDVDATVKKIGTLVSQKSSPSSKLSTDSEYSTLVIADSFRYMQQCARQCPAAVPGTVAWNGTMVAEYMPSWALDEWGLFLQNKYLKDQLFRV